MMVKMPARLLAIVTSFLLLIRKKMFTVRAYWLSFPKHTKLCSPYLAVNRNYCLLNHHESIIILIKEIIIPYHHTKTKEF